MSQTSMFDLLDELAARNTLVDEARARRDAALAELERLEDRGDPWPLTAYAWLIDYLLEHAELFGDDVWAAGLPAPEAADGRALGPVVRRLAREGLIERIGYRPRASGNLTPAPLWRSLIFQPSKGRAA